MTVYDALTLARLLDETREELEQWHRGRPVPAQALHRRGALRQWRDELMREAKEAADAPAP